MDVITLSLGSRAVVYKCRSTVTKDYATSFMIYRGVMIHYLPKHQDKLIQPSYK